jgi:hypothetical protein
MKKYIKCLIPSRKAKSSLVVLKVLFSETYVNNNFYDIKQYCFFCRRYIIECQQDYSQFKQILFPILCYSPLQVPINHDEIVRTSLI